MISPIEVSPASQPGFVKMVRVTQNARKQLVFKLTDDRGTPINLREEVETPPGTVPNWTPEPQAQGANVRVRLRTQRASTDFGGSLSLDIEGTILDQDEHRGFVQFELTTSDTPIAGIYEIYIERYIPNGQQTSQNDGIRVDTWPALMAVEPTSLGLLNTNVKGPLLLPEIRLAMLDIDSQNDGAPFSNLLDDTEFQDIDLVFAQRRVVQLWNETPPPIDQYTPGNFPYRYWWLEATVGHLLLMSAQRYRKNRLAYQAGGVAIDDQSKADEYQRIGREKIDRFMGWMQTEKYRLNMNRTWSTGI